MKTSIRWMVVSGLMVLSMVIASCGSPTSTTSSTTSTTPTITSQPAPSTTTTSTTTTEVPTQVPTGAVKPTSKTNPVYGGVLTVALTADPTAWDPAKVQVIRVAHTQMTTNELLQGDWTKGPQGTGETDWSWGYLANVKLETGELAESWDLKDDGTIIFHLRQGIKWHNRAPVNGRELTADDVVWSLLMQFNYPTAWQAAGYPPAKAAITTDGILPGGDSRRPTAITALDKYTVEIKCPSASQALMFMEIGDNAYTHPPEIWTGKAAGQGLGMGDWTKVVGSGPFVVTNYVPGSLLEYTAHPNYFETDPLYPGNKWPYVASLRQLIIPDASTRMAAFRVGKVDILQGLKLEDANQLLKQHPEILSQKRIASGYVAAGRLDKPELPFKDLKVRQAMNMAVDKQVWLRDYLKGDGEMLGYPYPPLKPWAMYYTPLDQMPDAVKQIFTYDPAKAKDLLKQAGYPNGFKTVIQVPVAYVDEVAIIKDYLGKVGIDMAIEPMEPAVYSNMSINRSQKEMVYGSLAGVWAPEQQMPVKRGMQENKAIIDDPYYDAVGKIIARDMVKNPEVFYKAVKDSAVYELGTAWGIFMPTYYTYNLWWPWVGNYMGISWTGWAGMYDWYKSVWIDTPMKKTMGYK